MPRRKNGQTCLDGEAEAPSITRLDGEAEAPSITRLGGNRWRRRRTRAAMELVRVFLLEASTYRGQLRCSQRSRSRPSLGEYHTRSGRAPFESINDKIVFVGTTALGTRELVATPLDTLFVGVEVQARVADNLLKLDFVHRLSTSGVFLSPLYSECVHVIDRHAEESVHLIGVRTHCRKPSDLAVTCRISGALRGGWTRLHAENSCGL
jgi:hypothetical protein